ncbi:glutathione transferase GstA [Epibacterium ulvae]|uniref:glutathione transferase GstA n=1 Tax=Epibacterium ulvae TaxID=1156985 RepID=UPI0024937589|nr:glutathione transferase GstA [Epibacterium ulvae]
MKLYYKPGACPLASHIALLQAGETFELVMVDTDNGHTENGEDYKSINPEGYVPALELDDGAILTEGPAILQFIADSHPQSDLAPAPGTLARARVQELLNWTGTELHKAFGPLFRNGTSDAEKTQARAAVGRKFDHIEALLADERIWLVEDRFSIADAYLFVVANWANFTEISLNNWPNLAAFVARTGERPAAQSAMRAEGLIQ